MNAQLFDVTSANAVLSLMGPKARDILQQVTRDDKVDELVNQLKDKDRGLAVVGEEEESGGVLVEPMHQTRPRILVLFHVSIEQPVDVIVRPGAALSGEAWRLVEHERGIGAQHQHGFGLRPLIGGQLPPFWFGTCHVAPRRHPQHLAGGEPVLRLDPLAVNANLSGARPARDRREVDLRQVALEPAIEPHPVVVGRDGELANFLAHAVTRIAISPR